MSTISIARFPESSTAYDSSRFTRTPVRAQRTDAAPVRLTRRGRLVLMIAVIAALAVAVVALGSSTVATGEAGVVPETRIVKVQEGQTLWQIAAEANPGGDVRDTVDDIMRMNSLPSAGALQLGADLAVPVYE